MEITVNRQALADHVKFNARVIGARVTLPALSGLLIEAADGEVTIKATDLEMSAQSTLTGEDIVTVAKPGKVLLPGKLFAQIMQKLPDAPVKITGDGNGKVQLTCGNATFGLRSMPTEDFPQLPSTADAVAVQISAGDLAELAVVAQAASSDVSRPVLTAAELKVADGDVTAAATDSYRLAVRRLTGVAENVNAEALVPARILSEVTKALSGDVTIQFGNEGQWVAFDLGDRLMTTRVVDGTFPDWKKLLPDAHETVVTIDTAAFAEALDRAGPVVSESANSSVTFAFGDDLVTMRTPSNTEAGDFNEAVPAEIDGDGMEISFNPSFLAVGVAATGTTQFEIGLRASQKPAVITPAGEDAVDFTYLIMPMRVN